MAQTIKLKRSSVAGRVPTTSDLDLGEVAINTADGKMYIKKDTGGTESIIEIGSSGVTSSFTLYEYTATASQTTFSGVDSNSNTLAYDTGNPPKVQVFLNGVLLDFTTDYTATNGTSVSLTVGANAGDLLQVAAYKSVTVDSDIALGDNTKLLLGNDSDFWAYHDGSNTIFNQTGTGNLLIQKDETTVAEVTASGITLTGELDTDTVQFDTTGTGVTSAGQIAWNTDTDTLELGLNADVNLELGEQNYFQVKAAQAISKGDVVYASGAVGSSSKIEVSKYIANNTIEEQRILGLAAEDMALNDFGFVISLGTLRGLQTDGQNLTTPESWALGDILYASAAVAGELTRTRPAAPNQAVPIAFITAVNSSAGALAVRAYELGSHLTEIHDVEITSVADNDLLQWNASTSRWENVAGTTSNIAEGTNLYWTTARGDSNFTTNLAASDTDDLSEGATNLYWTTARGDANFTTNLAASDTDDLSEGATNLYYTSARADADFDTRLATKSTTDLAEGTNLYYTQARFDTAFSAKSTTDLSEGTNLYYTDARFDTRLGTKSTTDLAEGTNLYYTSTRFDTAFSAKTTDNLSEGATNLYYTSARANTDFDTRLATKSTTDLTEGTNLYYTDARVGSYLTTNSYATQTYVSTAISNLVDSAPATLDTLNELAAALGDDPNFATTVTNSIAGKVSKSGDTMTGDLTVPNISGSGGEVVFAANSITTTTTTAETRLFSWSGANGFVKFTLTNGIYYWHVTANGVDGILTVDSNYNGSAFQFDAITVKYVSAEDRTYVVIVVYENATWHYTIHSDTSKLVGSTLITYSTTGSVGGTYVNYTNAYIPYSTAYAHRTNESARFETASIGALSISTLNGGTAWRSNNDGSGSGLDADLLDGQHGSYYAPASSLSSYVAKTGDTMSGNLTVPGINNSVAELIDLDDPTYLMLRDPQGSTGIYIGGTGDSNTYYDSNTHFFRSKNGGAERARINNAGVDAKSGGFLINGTAVIDSSRNLTNIVSYSGGAVDITPSSGYLMVRGGNTSASYTNKQIIFGYSGTTNYAQNIRSRHNAGAGTGNAIDVFLWDQANDAATDYGSLHAVKIETGKGIDLVMPNGAYQVAGTTVIDSSRQVLATAVIVDGNTAIDKTSNYMVYHDGAGAPALYAGNTSDNRNYYQSAHHRFRSDDGSVDFGEISSAGWHIGGTSTPSEALTVTGNIAASGTISSGAITSSGAGQFAGYLRVTQAGGAQTFLIGNQDSAGVNKPAMIMGVNGYLRLGHGDSWSGGGGTFTEAVSLSGNNLNITSGWLQMGGTNLVDPSRNLTNIGTISSGAITASGSGAAASPVIAITSSNSSAFIHASNAFAANMTAGQFHGHFFGKAGSTKNAGAIGYYWSSDGSNDNFVSIGHWGADHLLRLYGNGNLNIHNGGLQIGGTSVIDSSRNLTNIGTINGSRNQNSGYTHKLTNANTGTSAYTELTVESGSQELRIGTSENYADSQWDGSWVYAATGDLFLKSEDAHVKIYAGTSATPKWTFNSDGSIRQGDYNGTTVIDSGRNIFSARGKFTTAVHHGTTGYWKSRDNSGGGEYVLEYSTSDTLSDANIKWRVYSDGKTNQVGALQIGDTTVIDASRYIRNAYAARGTAGLKFEINDWFYDSSGTQARFYFEGAGRTFFASGNGYHFRDSADTTRLNINNYGGVNLLSGGDGQVASNVALAVSGTTVIDSSRNVSNIGTISSGNITISNNSADPTLTFTTTSATADPVIQMNGQGGISTEGFEIWYDNSVGDVHLHTTYNHADAAIRFHTRTGASKATSNERFTITGNGDIQVGGTTVIDNNRRVQNANSVSINTAFESGMGLLHIKASDSGAAPYETGNEGIVVERNGRTAINLLSPATSSGYLFFADPQSATAGYVGYDHSVTTLELKSEAKVKTYGTGLDVVQGTLDVAGTTIITGARNLTNIVDAVIGESGGAPYNTLSSGNLFFGDSDVTDKLGYSIGLKRLENINGNYTKLNIDWHTGITLGAATTYGGVRFFDNSVGYYNSTTKLFSVGEGDSHVRVYNDLKMGSTTVIDSGRNLTNIGTIASGSHTITSSSISFDALTLGSTTQSQYTNLVLNSNSGNAQLWKQGTTTDSWGGASALNIYNSNGVLAFHPQDTANVLQIDSGGPNIGGTKTLRHGGTTVLDASRNLTNIGGGANTASIGSASFSWGGSTAYPTIYGSSADRWVMLCFPHIPYLKNGVRGHTGGTYGSITRYEGDTSTSTYWDVGCVGENQWSLYRNQSDQILNVNNSDKMLQANYGLLLYGRSDAWNETTPGLAIGTMHMEPATTDNYGSAITWGASDSNGGHAGIYVRSDGSYGTKMYLATTDSYATGSKSAIVIDQSGKVALLRDRLSIGAGGYAPNPDANVYLSPSELQFGGNNNGKESNSAQISAGQHQGNSLNFVGMSSGTTASDRRMDFWVEGGAYFRGDVVATGNVTAYGSASDRRLKTNIRSIPDALGKLKAVSGYLFDWNENAPEDKQGKTEYGVIAQEVEAAGLDELVFEYERPVNKTGGDDTPPEKWKAVHYDKFVPLLIEAVKMQQEQINELKAQLKEIKNGNH